MRTSSRRRTKDARRLTAAREVLTELPRRDETLHLLHVGNFDGIDLLTVALELIRPATVPHMRIASLGLNDRTLDVLLRFMDSGSVGTLTLLLSHYFRHADPSIYNRTHSEVTRRAGRVAIARSHCKVWVMRDYVFAGSGNLRSCKSLEQVDIAHDGTLADFHSQWIDQLVTECHR